MWDEAMLWYTGASRERDENRQRRQDREFHFGCCHRWRSNCRLLGGCPRHRLIYIHGWRPHHQRWRWRGQRWTRGTNSRPPKRSSALTRFSCRAAPALTRATSLCAASLGSLIPCLDPGASRATPALHAISCAARRHSITVALDMGDVQPCSVYPANKTVVCSECPLEGVFRFNSQVAVGSRGEILAKYHKMHPYNPSPHASCIGDGHQEPGLHDPRFFDTSFGVRFAMHLCASRFRT